MAFIVETGIGLPNANAFCSIAFADGFHSGQIDGIDWLDLDLADKQIALMTATTLINLGYDFHGRRLTRDQALEFPRWGLRDRAGYMHNPSVMPRAILSATAELARILRARADAGVSATGTVVTPPSSAGAVEKIQVGPIALTLASSSSTGSGSNSSTSSSTVAPLIPRAVSSFLLDYGTPRFGYGSARLER